MSIPQKLFITDLTAMKSSTLGHHMQDFLNKVVGDHAQVYLTLYLLEHMLGFNLSETGNSFYQPYFDMLPQSLDDFSSNPATWSPEDLTLLDETSAAHKEAISFKKNCMHDYELFSSVSG